MPHCAPPRVPSTVVRWVTPRRARIRRARVRRAGPADAARLSSRRRRDTHTLILGSFPGVASLAATQYYAHPRNQFWRLVGTVIGEPLHELPYDERVRRVLAHGIGLWDVLAACEREGSLDAAIRNANPNDFASFRLHAPRLKKSASTARPRAASSR